MAKNDKIEHKETETQIIEAEGKLPEANIVDPTIKIKNFVSKFVQNEKVAESLTKIVTAVDYSIDFIVRPKSTRYEHDPVVEVARAPIAFGIWVIIFTFGFFGVWATFFPLDVASHCMGTLVVGSNRKTVQHLEGGVIKDIYVRNGDSVKKGQPLILLSNSKTKANLEILESQNYSFKAHEARLIAERYNKNEIEFPKEVLDHLDDPKVKETVENQKRIFKTSIEGYQGKIGTLEKKIAQYGKQIDAFNSKLTASKKQLSVFTERLQAARKLNESGYGARAQLLEWESRFAAAQGEVGETENNILQVKQSISSTEIEINNTKNEFMTSVVKELKDVEASLSEITARINAAQDEIERMSIVAPQDGVVHNFQYFAANGQIEHYTVGGVIHPGAHIMDIVPQHEPLVVEAKVRQNDIDAVNEGLKAKMKITAFKSRNTPDIYGKVTYVSPDVTYDRDPMSGASIPVYNVRIELDKEQFQKDPRLKKLQLWPGMQADVLIVTGSRPFLKYLLDPITDSFRASFIER